MAGLRVLNDAGWVQINSEQLNLRLVAKGVAATTRPLVLVVGQTPTTIGWYEYVEVPGAQMVAIRCSQFCAVHASQASQTSGAGARTFVFMVNTQASVEWWAFGPGTDAVFNSGIRIWNSAGQQVYDGADKLPKMHGMTQRIVAPSGSAIAGSSSAPLLGMAPLINTVGAVTIGSAQNQATVFTLAGARTPTASGYELTAVNIDGTSGSASSPTYGQWLLLDVSNL